MNETVTKKVLRAIELCGAEEKLSAMTGLDKSHCYHWAKALVLCSPKPGEEKIVRVFLDAMQKTTPDDTREKTYPPQADFPVVCLTNSFDVSVHEVAGSNINEIVAERANKALQEMTVTTLCAPDRGSA